MDNTDKLATKRKRLLIVGIIVFCAFIISIVVIAIVEARKTAKIGINVIPRSAEILLNGKSIANRKEHSIEPGTYEVLIKNDGFVGKIDTISIAAGDHKTIKVCLTADVGNEKWYDEHPDEKNECELIGSSDSERDEVVYQDSLWDILPYRSYEKGFHIAPEINDDNTEITGIVITAYTCNRTRMDSIVEGAKQWLEYKGIDVSQYKITSKSSCIDSD